MDGCAGKVRANVFSLSLDSFEIGIEPKWCSLVYQLFMSFRIVDN